MKKRILFLFLVTSGFAFGQMDSLNPLTSKQIADSVFQSVNHLIPTGKLYNRLLYEDTIQSICWNQNQIGKNDTTNHSSADYLYGALYELKAMSIDTASVPGQMAIYNPVSRYLGEAEFELDSYHYPMGIIDYDYDYVDIATNKQEGWITESNHVIELTSENLLVKTKQVQIVGPLFDLHDSDEMALIFMPENFYSNRKTSNDITNIELEYNGTTSSLQLNELFYFNPVQDSIQLFRIKVFYNDNTFIENYTIINTPELYINKNQNNSNKFALCEDLKLDGEKYIEDSGNKLKWCWIERCGSNNRVFKPFILLTGYRPPIIGQSFRKTWKIYNHEHADLLLTLLDNNYDVFLVKFNIHAKPNTHGLLESAALFEEFLLKLNALKGGQASGQENIIQASSMSADIARLTLLTMEQKHLSNTPADYPHHHTRLFISYDGNFYGANIPLAYQFQIYSHFKHPVNISVVPGVPTPYQSLKIFFSSFLYATMEQKTVQQLLMYHAKAPYDNLFENPYQQFAFTPTHHWRRQEFYDKLATVDNGVHIFPMPLSSRNVSISLGKIKETNDVENGSTQGNDFPFAGKYWRKLDAGAFKFHLRAAKYTGPNENTEIFWRRKIGLNWINPPVNHRVHVNQMQEIDNASGSFLAGAGNIISVADWTYFTLLNIVDGRNYFSHKSVVTALGINRNIWPANGSLTLDMQALGLMYNSFYGFQNDVKSNHNGYPNLGRPNDHFYVTPFEAIYVDNKINPHIKLDEDDPVDLEQLNDFIRNETEPWYLGLQNKHIGADARPNYRYHSYRRAKHTIVVGNKVTPTTDPGDFTVEANGKLTLKAGDFIQLFDGTHFKAGSDVHIVPEYQACTDYRIAVNPDSDENTSEKTMNKDFEQVFPTRVENQSFFIFPNPGSDSFEIGSESMIWQIVKIFDVNGTLLGLYHFDDSNIINVSAFNVGIYIIQIQGENNIETHKFLKL